MDEMSPRNWSGTEHIYDSGELPDPDQREAWGVIPTWLLELPCAAAVIRPSAPGGAVIEHWNAKFSRSMSQVLDREGAGDANWIGQCLDTIGHFANADEESHRFQIERRTDLGNEVFACRLAWVAGPSGRRDRILFTAIDRTTDRRLEDSLRRELVSDSLTTLPNRTGFSELVEQMIGSTGCEPETEIMILIIDLARFSRINESLGSLEGDELILTVAKRLKSCFGDNVVLARIGGDEFALCCTLSNGITDAMSIAEQAKAAITQPVRLSTYQISIGCAIGCAISEIASADGDELVRQAQSAVRTAKLSDRLEVYRASVLKAAQRRFHIESRLRDALHAGGLQLAYQPLVNLSNNMIIGFEALTRWKDDELGIVSPTEFIDVAEDSGLIVPLGRWAMNEAMQQLARWDRRFGDSVPLKMNVNLSPIQIARDDVISMVANALRLSGVDGRRLTVELTESAVVGDPDNCRNLLAALKGFNVSIAMDDFGTGFSNMASLQSLPIDVLKIDRSFITDMLIDPDKHAIIRAILSLAEALKLSTTAEGIETEYVADTLCDLGCTTGQGYYYAKPMTADAAFDYWHSRWNFEAI